jgi:hypothetical protein
MGPIALSQLRTREAEGQVTMGTTAVCGVQAETDCTIDLKFQIRRLNTTCLIAGIAQQQLSTVPVVKQTAMGYTAIRFVSNYTFYTNLDLVSREV